MDRSRISVLAAVALMGGTVAAHGGPCTAQIAQLEAEIRGPALGAENGPTAPQSVDAQLHHQPTPGLVENAERQANAAAAAALEQARQADAAGNASACSKALEEARRLYGID